MVSLTKPFDPAPKPSDETARVHYTHGVWNRLVEVRADDSGSPRAFIAEYSYDLYRLTGVERGNLVDGQNGKEISGTPGFTQDWDLLDSLGNWAEFDDDGTAQTREVDEANQIKKIDGSSDDVAHDAAGNMIRVPKLDGSGDHFHLVYDDNGTTLIAEYQYDGTGRRIVKGVDDDSDGSLDTFTHFFHNAQNQVLETREGDDVSGAAPAAETLEPKHQNIWSPRYVDSLILRDECDAQGQIIPAARLYYLSDANYNVTGLVDANGNVVERYLYTPYGTVAVLDPDFSVDADGKSDYDNTTLYTGRELDAETELMYYRARYYHSELGRFISRDPIGYEGGISLYAYVGDSPTIRTDPLGRMSYVTVTGYITHDHGNGYADFQCDCPPGYTSSFGTSNVYHYRPKSHVPTLTCFRPSRWDRVCQCVTGAWAAVCATVSDTVDYTFDTLADAGQWIHDHPGQATVGAVVIVGGATFIVVSGGSGALILAPVAL